MIIFFNIWYNYLLFLFLNHFQILGIILNKSGIYYLFVIFDFCFPYIQGHFHRFSYHRADCMRENSIGIFGFI